MIKVFLMATYSASMDDKEMIGTLQRKMSSNSQGPDQTQQQPNQDGEDSKFIEK